MPATVIYTRSPESALRSAVFARISGLVVNGRATPCLDEVPPGTEYDYFEVGDYTAVQWGTKSHGGVDATLTIHAWSNYQGAKRVAEMCAAIIRELSRRDLVLLDNFSVAWSSLDLHENFKDTDGRTRHGVVRFRWKIQDLS